MMIQELVRRFPEIPPDLHDEPLLAQFADALVTCCRWRKIQATVQDSMRRAIIITSNSSVR
jgi:hypothetical protein